jgi:hypothetical protein
MMILQLHSPIAVLSIGKSVDGRLLCSAVDAEICVDTLSG